MENRHPSATSPANAAAELSSFRVTPTTSTSGGPNGITIRVTDSGGNYVEDSITGTLNVPLSFSTIVLPPGTQGSTYPSFSFAASGGTGPGTYTFTQIAGTLPAGIRPPTT